MISNDLYNSYLIVFCFSQDSMLFIYIIYLYLGYLFILGLLYISYSCFFDFIADASSKVSMVNTS